jgi:malonyl CoA-acyl carrier protein transacylase
MVVSSNGAVDVSGITLAGKVEQVVTVERSLGSILAAAVAAAAVAAVEVAAKVGDARRFGELVQRAREIVAGSVLMAAGSAHRSVAEPVLKDEIERQLEKTLTEEVRTLLNTFTAKTPGISLEQLLQGSQPTLRAEP